MISDVYQGKYDPVAINTVIGLVPFGLVRGIDLNYTSDNVVALSIELTPLSRHNIQDFNKSVYSFVRLCFLHSSFQQSYW